MSFGLSDTCQLSSTRCRRNPFEFAPSSANRRMLFLFLVDSWWEVSSWSTCQVVKFLNARKQRIASESHRLVFHEELLVPNSYFLSELWVGRFACVRLRISCVSIGHDCTRQAADFSPVES